MSPATTTTPPATSRSSSARPTPTAPSISGYSGVYDGAAHGATGYCLAVNGTTHLAGLDLGASFTNVPGGTAHWVFTDVTGNYNDTAGDVAIVISKADADCSAISGYSGVYDGAAHGATGYCLAVNGTTHLAGLDLGASFTNVPGGTAHWVFTDVTGNYNDTAGDVAIVISKANTTTSVVSSVNPSVWGQSVTFTATVSPVAPGAGTRTGTVTFYDGLAVLGTGSVNAAGVATLSTTGLSVASHSITAVYGGDGNFNGSTSAVLSQVVSKANTTTSVVSSVNPSVWGQSVTLA